MTRGTRGPPPRWARALLDSVLPIGVAGESILGDLESEYLDLQAPHWVARLWYSFEAIKIALHYRKGMGMSDFMQDVRYGFRMLRRMPLVTIVAALSLAAGIGASTTMFAIMYGFLYAPFPYTDQDDLQTVLMMDRAMASERTISSGTMFELAERVPALQDFVAWRSVRTTMTSGVEPVQVVRLDATPNIFEVLGRSPAIGRAFTPDEDNPGSDLVVVLTHQMWETSFGADPGILGQSIEMAGRNYTVLGVMPEDFEFFPSTIGLVTVNTFESERDMRSGAGVTVVLTLPDGVTPDQVRLQADAAWERIAAESPDELARVDFHMVPLRGQFPGESDRRLVQVMLFVALFVLIIAAANVANLLLARAEERGQEIAVRVSLGAGRVRLLRQLLTESTMLAALGGVMGVSMAVFAINQLAGLMPVGIPRAFGPQLQPPVLAFTVFLSLGVGVFFGLAPALQALRPSQRAALGEGVRGGTAGRGKRRIRTAFVVGEIAVALALLAGAGSLTNMANGIVNVDLGLRSEGLLTFRTMASGAQYDEPSALAQFHRDMEVRLLSLPQATGVAAMDELPRGRSIGGPDFTIDGREPEEGQEMPETLRLSVNHGYFATMEIPLREGRLFESGDREDQPLVAVVSETFAGYHFPDESPLGHRITIDGASREIVGVVGDVFHSRVELPGGLAGMAYLPLPQRPIRGIAYAVRLAGEPTAVAGQLRTAVRSVDASAAVNDVKTLDDFIAGEMALIQVLGGAVGGFGLLALILSAMGIYGVMAHAVAQRNREIGIRMALGAEGGTMIRMLLRNGVGQAVIGVLIGLPLAFLIRQAAVGISVQFKADVGGPMIIAVVAAVLTAVCLLASYVPARKAAGVSPISALRGDG